MEKVNLKKLIYQVKVLGTLVTVGGAMLMTLYKGPIVEMVWSKHARSSTSNSTATHDKDWVKGSILVILATLAWSALFIIQVKLLSRQEPNTPFFLPLLNTCYSWRLLNSSWSKRMYFSENYAQALLSSVSYNIDMLCGNSSIHCSHSSNGAQSVCLAYWLGHEPSSCGLCC